MAEEQQGQEKTEEATPRKLTKAKEEGQVARSRELNTVAIVTFGAVAAYFFIPGIAEALISLTKALILSAAAIEMPLTHYLDTHKLASNNKQLKENCRTETEPNGKHHLCD